MLHSYDDLWSLNIQRHHSAFDAAELQRQTYAPLALRGINTGVISSRSSLSNYKLVLATPHTIDATIAKELITFVRGGGTLVVGPRSGFKTLDNALQPERQPALLHEIARATVAEYYGLREQITLHATGLSVPAMTAHTWAEWLVPDNEAQVLASYGPVNGWLDGQAAITVKKHAGGGRVYQVGTWLSTESWDALLGDILSVAQIKAVLPGSPKGVHARQRGNCVILINSAEPRTVQLPWVADESLTNQRVDSVTLAP